MQTAFAREREEWRLHAETLQQDSMNQVMEERRRGDMLRHEETLAVRARAAEEQRQAHD